MLGHYSRALRSHCFSAVEFEREPGQLRAGVLEAAAENADQVDQEVLAVAGWHQEQNF